MTALSTKSRLYPMVQAMVNDSVNQMFVTSHKCAGALSGDIDPYVSTFLDEIKEALTNIIVCQTLSNVENPNDEEVGATMAATMTRLKNFFNGDPVEQEQGWLPVEAAEVFGQYLSDDVERYPAIYKALQSALSTDPQEMIDLIIVGDDPEDDDNTINVWEKVEMRFTVKEFCDMAGIVENEGNSRDDDSEAKYFRNNTFNGANLD